MNCHRCNGTGRVKRSMSQKPLRWQIHYVRCSACHGTGKVEAKA